MADDLADEAAIRRAMDRYGQGVDERDWEAWAEIFADPLETDFSGIDPAFEPTTLARADHVRGTRAVLEQFDATHHVITNVQVDVSGDEAAARAVLCAEHWLDGLGGSPRYTMFGVYENRFRRTAAGWKLSRLTLRLRRTEGNAEVWAEALRRARTGERGSGP